VSLKHLNPLVAVAVLKNHDLLAAWFLQGSIGFFLQKTSLFVSSVMSMLALSDNVPYNKTNIEEILHMRSGTIKSSLYKPTTRGCSM